MPQIQYQNCPFMDTANLGVKKFLRYWSLNAECVGDPDLGVVEHIRKLFDRLKKKRCTHLLIFFKWAILGLFNTYFSVFFTRKLQLITTKNVHPVSGGGIQTHNLLGMSLLP